MQRSSSAEKLQRNLKFKIVLVGDPYVGKTSLSTTFVKGKNAFPQTYVKTTEYVKQFKQVKLEDKTILLEIWDLSGMDAFRHRLVMPTTGYHYDNSDGLMVVYSVRDDDSLNGVNEWLRHVREYLGDIDFSSLKKMVVGTKADKRRVNVIDKQKNVMEKTRVYSNMSYMLTSAKTGHNIDEAFITLVRQIYEPIAARSNNGPLSPTLDSASRISAPSPTRSESSRRLSARNKSGESIFSCCSAL